MADPNQKTPENVESAQTKDTPVQTEPETISSKVEVSEPVSQASDSSTDFNFNPNFAAL